ncbi:HAD-like domain-containing protein [Truncatella angustata]|uniref:HAD-like domain-containing protein n=1 Tax=Truncatella angustata TaxID=152316 RepID=A0A9P8UAX3_9PEZI|nr:HAD-like domain-containing protein [Truncatella angustata]KAH6647856.1 HAD-like domain-containing protein [Truncatella angustata]
MDRLEASLSITGMTCASCSNNILTTLKKSEWITKAAVDLLNNSAKVEFIGENDNAQQIVDAIEELGYEAHLDQVRSQAPDTVEERGHRTVDIRIDGFHCELCPNRVTTRLLDLQQVGVIGIISQPTKDRPIMTVKYVPEPSKLNIRQILAAINVIDPAFQASIYHPTSTEERSRQIHARHQQRILLRLLGTLAVAIPTFIIGIVYMSLVSDMNSTRHYLMSPLADGISRAQIALLVMATPVYFCAADLFHRRALKELWMLWKPSSRTPILQRFYRFGSMNMLMSLGTSIAYISSLAQIIAAAVHPRKRMVDDSNFYFDSVVFLTLFLLAGRLIEAYSKSRTGDAVEMLCKLRPTTAVLVEGIEGGDSAPRSQTIAAELLDLGDLIQVSHGASPPCDGEVVQGVAQFDESSLTGESRLIKKSAGDGVFAGTVNKGQPVRVRVTGVAGQSMLDKIVEVVREGQAKRAPMERIADVLTAYFVPAITLIAILTWLIWFILGVSGRLPEKWLNDSSESWIVFSLQFAIAVFVVACPCGLGLAAPTAIYVGGGLAAKYGILAKGGGEAFEKASHLKCVVFDKTGTITQGGEPQVTDHEIYRDVQQPESFLLAAVGSLEQHSSHPIAKAMQSFCSDALATSQAISLRDVEEIPGKGLKGTCDGFDMIIGNAKLMTEFDVDMSSSSSTSLDMWKSRGHSVALAAIRTAGQATYQLAASFGISDPIRAEAAPVIAALQGQGVEVWMLSGDNLTTARAVAQRVGIPSSHVMAEVLPTDKADKVREIRAAGPAGRGGIAMVGDGINDAPALAVADVGIAIGSGTDVAISSADFVLVNSDLRSVVTLLGLSGAVFRRIKFNFCWALVYNLLAVPFAAGCFYALGVRLDPVWASLAMALSSISVVLSSLALRLGIPVLGFRAREIPVGVV